MPIDLIHAGNIQTAQGAQKIAVAIAHGTLCDVVVIEMPDKQHPHFLKLGADAFQALLKQLGKQGGVVTPHALLCGREPVRFKEQIQMIL